MQKFKGMELNGGLEFRAVKCSDCGGKIYFYVFIGERGEHIESRFCRSCGEENFAFVRLGKFYFSGGLPF